MGGFGERWQQNGEFCELPESDRAEQDEESARQDGEEGVLKGYRKIQRSALR